MTTAEKRKMRNLVFTEECASKRLPKALYPIGSAVIGRHGGRAYRMTVLFRYRDQGKFLYKTRIDIKHDNVIHSNEVLVYEDEILRKAE